MILYIYLILIVNWWVFLYKKRFSLLSQGRTDNDVALFILLLDIILWLSMHKDF